MTEWPRELELGVAQRTMPGERRSGDLPVLAAYEGGALVGAIDGLGHGEEAAEAADAAAAVLGAAPRDEPEALLLRCHRALSRTRGAVMTLAWVDVPGRSLRWTGVGNVEGRLVRGHGDARTPTEGAFVRGGVVGYNLPPVRVTTTALADGDLVVLATDGVQSGFGRELTADGEAQGIADRILRAHAKGTDDALVVVVRFRPGA